MSNSEVRGILTKADREWLRGEKEYKHRQTEADRRQEIRDRVGTALQDFALLIENWSPEERRKTLEGIDHEQSATDMIEFLYLGLNELANDAEQMADNDAVDRALAFRRSLCRGIRCGKEHFGDAPDSVLIDSNTELHEVPSVKDLQSALDTSQWQNANNHVRGAFDEPDDALIEKEDAASQFQMDLQLSVEHELYSRRQRSNSEIRRHETFVGPVGLLGESEDQ